ncbi:DNA methyltransferase [Rubripirellula sp.]|nr:DNA methyltransferase [Rubripirellula sp.]
MTTSIERDFPFEHIDVVAEQESWRKEVNRPLNHIHKWWAHRLGTVFRGIVLGACSASDTDIWSDFYSQHNFHDKIVLDPFMGSGTTVGEAIKLGCRAIGCDINPISTFMVTQAYTQVSEQDLQDGFDRVEKRVKYDIQRCYKTTHPETGEECDILYTFWVKTVIVPSGVSVPLFSSFVFSKNAIPSKKPAARILCPNCRDIIHDRFDVKKLQCPHCKHDFEPRSGNAKGQLVCDPITGEWHKIKTLIQAHGLAPDHEMYAIMALTPAGEKVYLKPTENDRSLYDQLENELKAHEKVFQLPSLKLERGHNTDQAIGNGYKSWRDFYNHRQLYCLGRLLAGILEEDDGPVRDHLLCLFSSTLEFNNLFCSFKGEGTGAVRHIFSHHILKPERTPLENCVWGTNSSSGTFQTLFKSRLLRAKRYLSDPFELAVEVDNGRRKSSKISCNAPINMRVVDDSRDFLKSDDAVLVLNGDSRALPLDDQTVDAVITDPPYFDFVHYSELSDFFFAWLGPVLKSKYEYCRTNSTRKNGEVQDRCSESFSTKLCEVFAESHRVLKDDGLLVFSFHHSRIEGWEAIYDAIVGAGFFIQSSYPVKAEMSVASPKSGNKNPINIDALLVCKKIGKQQPIRWTTAKKQCLSRFREYITRLSEAGRNLSKADRQVVAISQLMAIASQHHGAVKEKGSIMSFNMMVAEIVEASSQHLLFELSPA